MRDQGTATAPEWLTVREVADHLRVHPRTVSRWVNNDPTLKVKRIGPTGRTIRIHRSELDRNMLSNIAA